MAKRASTGTLVLQDAEKSTNSTSSAVLLLNTEVCLSDDK